MTRDEVITLARKAGLVDDSTKKLLRERPPVFGESNLELFAALVAAAKKEECAKICDKRDTGDMTREDMEARRCAEAIRSEGNT